MGSHAKFTPGPWEKDGTVIWARCEGQKQARVVAQLSEPQPRSNLVSHEAPGISSKSWDEIVANGNMIVSVPDLHAKLQLLVSEVKGLARSETEIREAIGNTNWNCLMRRVDEALAALAKAEGQEAESGQ